MASCHHHPAPAWPAPARSGAGVPAAAATWPGSPWARGSGPAGARPPGLGPLALALAEGQQTCHPGLGFGGASLEQSAADLQLLAGLGPPDPGSSGPWGCPPAGQTRRQRAPSAAPRGVAGREQIWRRRPPAPGQRGPQRARCRAPCWRWTAWAPAPGRPPGRRGGPGSDAAARGVGSDSRGQGNRAHRRWREPGGTAAAAPSTRSWPIGPGLPGPGPLASRPQGPVGPVPSPAPAAAGSGGRGRRCWWRAAAAGWPPGAARDRDPSGGCAPG